MHTVIEKGRKHAKTYETDGNVSSDRRNAWNRQKCKGQLEECMKKIDIYWLTEM
jgi:hypothetical protein